MVLASDVVEQEEANTERTTGGEEEEEEGTEGAEDPAAGTVRVQEMFCSSISRFMVSPDFRRTQRLCRRRCRSSWPVAERRPS